MNLAPPNARQGEAGGGRAAAGTASSAGTGGQKVRLHFRGPHGMSFVAEMRGAHCSIGSAATNEVVIEHPGLANMHAIVHNVGGVLTITACPDAEVFVNGKEVAGTVRLKDGDGIGLGSKVTATVSLMRQAAPVLTATRPPRFGWSESAVRLRSNIERALAHIGHPDNWKIIAAAAAAALLLLIATIFLWQQRRASSSETAPPSLIQPEPQPTTAENLRPGDDSAQRQNAVTPTPAPRAATPGRVPEAERTEKVRSVIKRVMRRIAPRDNEPYVDDAVAADVERQINVYVERGDVAGLLAAEAGSFQAVAKSARKESLEPSLLIIAALLEKEESGRGAGGRDLTQVARTLLPQLKRLAIKFSSKDADSCLLIIAAHDEIKYGRHTSDIISSLKTVRDPKLERNFKFLYDQGGLSGRAYEHVIRFLALGAIALEPRALGVEGEPLPF